MSNDFVKEDRLAERIRKRREAAVLENSPTLSPAINPPIEKPNVEPAKVVETVLPKLETVSVKPNSDVQKMVAYVVEEINQNANPLKIAKMLAEIQTAGLNGIELGLQVGKSKAWISKRLGLLKASEEVQLQIESGVLSEHEFYSRRAQVEAEASKKKRQTLQYARMPTVTISIDAAHALAGILKKLTIEHKLNTISLDQSTGKKELVSILNLRPFDILKAIK